MRIRRIAVALIAVAAILSMSGCGDDTKKAVADTLDSLGNLAQEVLEEAPTGEEIVGAVEGVGDAVSNIASDIGDTFRKGQENNSDIVTGVLE